MRRFDLPSSPVPASLALFPLDPRLTLQLVGTWRFGGLLEILLEGESLAQLQFSACKWAVLALLFERAIQASSTHWFHAHITAWEVAKVMKERHLLSDRATERVHQLVHQIRANLATSGIHQLTGDAELSGKQWARALLQTSRGAGYRIALPPVNLTLLIGGKRYRVVPEQGDSLEGCEHRDSSLGQAGVNRNGPCQL